MIKDLFCLPTFHSIYIWLTTPYCIFVVMRTCTVYFRSSYCVPLNDKTCCYCFYVFKDTMPVSLNQNCLHLTVFMFAFCFVIVVILLLRPKRIIYMTFCNSFCNVNSCSILKAPIPHMLK